MFRFYHFLNSRIINHLYRLRREIFFMILDRFATMLMPDHPDLKCPLRPDSLAMTITRSNHKTGARSQPPQTSPDAMLD